MYNITLWHNCVTTVAMETQQCVLFVTVVEIQNILHNLHFLCCPRSLILLVWRDCLYGDLYHSPQYLHCGLLFYIKIQFIPSKDPHVHMVLSVRLEQNLYIQVGHCQQYNWYWKCNGNSVFLLHFALHASVNNAFMAIFCLWQQRNLFKSSCKVSHFNQIGIFLTDFHNRSKHKFMKIHFVETELIHTDMTKLIGTFHKYVKMAKNTCVIIMNHFPPCIQHLIQYFWH